MESRTDGQVSLMTPILIATAGHVDHGKSTLVQTLTGTDPDRWDEEKERGITIDLGYAHANRNNRAYSFVDVPGHEKFIHNMLAGIGSIDAVLFVIAADESIMPQTREHALALRYLGVEQIAVVLTKVDLVDEDLLELLDLELAEWLEEQGWGDAPIVRFSSKKPETHEAVWALMESFQKKVPEQSQAFRLSVDRVFTSPGSGTVITGTVERGTLKPSDEVVVMPAGSKSRIRQIQLHGEKVDQIGPHSRAALNLGDLHYKDMGRGNSIYRTYVPENRRRLLIRLESFDSEWQPKPKHYFHVHHLAAHLRARMMWRHEGLAALELDEPYGFWSLDRGLIRDGSPLRVCGGFEVLHPDPRPIRKRQVLPILENLPRAGDLVAWQRWYVATQEDVFDAGAIPELCGAPLADEVLEELVALDRERYITKNKWDAFTETFRKGLQKCHMNMPLYEFIPLNRVNNHFDELKLSPALRDALFRHGQEQGLVAVDKNRVRLLSRRPAWTPGDKQRLTEFLAPMKRGPLKILDVRELPGGRDHYSDIEGLLIWEGFLVSLSPDLLIDCQFLDKIIQTLHQRYSGQDFSVGDLKELFQFSRKYAIPLLEYLDKIGCTRRVEEGRSWIATNPPRFACSWEPPK